MTSNATIINTEIIPPAICKIGDSIAIIMTAEIISDKPEDFFFFFIPIFSPSGTTRRELFCPSQFF